MAGVVRVVGRFAPSEVVALVLAAGPHVLSPAGGSVVARARVDGGGVVEFKEGVEVGARYFVTGNSEGHPVSVRCAGVADGDSTHLSQAPVAKDVQKFPGGERVPAVVSGARLDGELEAEGRAAKRVGRPRGASKRKVALVPLQGAALKERARKLDIKGRGSMSAEELRAAVQKAAA